MKRRNPWTEPRVSRKASMPPAGYRVPLPARLSEFADSESVAFIFWNLRDSVRKPPRVILSDIDTFLLQQATQYLVEKFDQTGIWWPQISMIREVAEDFAVYSDKQFSYLGSIFSSGVMEDSDVKKTLAEAFAEICKQTSRWLEERQDIFEDGLSGEPLSLNFQRGLVPYIKVLIASGAMTGDIRLADGELLSVYRRVLFVR